MKEKNLQKTGGAGRRICSMLLAAALVFTSIDLPLTARAAEPEQAEGGGTPGTAFDIKNDHGVSLIKEGQLYYQLSEDGTELTITGEATVGPPQTPTVETEYDITNEFGEYLKGLPWVTVSSDYNSGYKINCKVKTARIDAKITGEFPAYFFYEYPELEKIEITGDASGITSIGRFAFCGTKITSVSWLENLTNLKEIKPCAFEDCTGLTEVTIPEGVTSVNRAFEDCTGLTKVTIPEGVTSIGYAFHSCTGLTEVTIPKSVTSCNGAFSGCTGLTEVTIPEGVASIGDATFSGCTGLTEVTIPDSVTSIGYGAFHSCTGLTEVTIPDSVTSIGKVSSDSTGAFEGCTGLTVIKMPDNPGFKYIGFATFKGCTGLTEVTIPASVTAIYDSAFQDCTSLETVTIPESVYLIGHYTFQNCTSLETVTIPAKVSEIGRNAFGGCTSLKSVVMEHVVVLGESPRPELSDDVFENCAFMTEGTKGIIVPKGNLNRWTYDKKFQDEAEYSYKRWQTMFPNMKEAMEPLGNGHSHIADKEDLEKLRELVSSGVDMKDFGFEVQGDIDLKGSAENPWTPIGTEEHPFNGEIDGKGHTISGLYINDENADNQGLFGFNAGNIYSFTAEGEVTGRDNVGGIAGTNTGVIKCNANVTVRGRNSVGGIAGNNSGSVHGATNQGSVSGTDNVGGIAGNNSPIVSDGTILMKGYIYADTNQGSVSGTDNVGGIVGTNSAVMEWYNYNEGNVSGESNIGGIVGTNEASGEVKGGIHKGTVTGSEGTTGTIIGTNRNQTQTDIEDEQVNRAETQTELPKIGNQENLPEPAFEGGGTENDPYKIKTEEDLIKLAELVNSGEDQSGACYRIEADITLTDAGKPWTPIGTNEHPFTGTFDGNGKTVSGLYINDNAKNDQGLFGVNAGTIENLTAEGSVTGKDNVGAIAGTNTENGTIKDCISNVAVNGQKYVGGIAGQNDGTVTGCTDNGSGTRNHPYEISNKEELEKLRDSVNEGFAYTDKYFRLTGDINLEGSDENQWTPIGTYEHPFEGIFLGDEHTISGLYIKDAGAYQGLFGVNGGTIENLTVEGSVTAQSFVGGIAGQNYGIIKDCTAKVAVSGNGNVGGIAGSNREKNVSSDRIGTVTGCINEGAVSGTYDKANSIGGIVGYNPVRGIVKDNINSANVTGRWDYSVGAIIGQNQNKTTEDITGNYYRKDVNHNYSLSAIGGSYGQADPDGTTCGTSPRPFLKGSGTKDAPYKISDKTDLEILRDAVNEGTDYTGKYFVIAEDIDLAGSAENPWTPIGTNEHPFGGILLGEGHTIKGLYISNEAGDNQGLFGVNAGTIENLRAEGSVTGHDNVGGIAGTNTRDGVIRGCIAKIDVTGNNYVEGIAGKNEGTIENCIHTGSINGEVSESGTGFGGEGTPQKPYEIRTAEDLQKIQEAVESDPDKYKDAYFELMNDITLGGEGFTPIGTAEKPFEGTFSGNGHTISGLVVNDSTGDNQGLFGVNAGTIENLTVEGSVTGQNNVGGIAGTNTEKGIIRDCISNAKVSGGDNVGGIVGKNEGSVIRCATKTDGETESGSGTADKGSVTGTGTNTGGIAGNNSGTIKDSTNNAEVTGGSANTGGVTGTNGTKGIVDNSGNNGNVTTTGGEGDSTGALVGKNENGAEDSVSGSYKKDENTNTELNGIGAGTGAGTGTDPEGVTSVTEDVQNPTKPFEGSGTLKDPYKIKTEEDLGKLAELVNSGEDQNGLYYKIEAEEGITLTEESKPWTPIGTEDHPFTGNFDGNGKTVSGLEINDNTKDNQGLFGVNAGTIENLTVEGSVTGQNNVGGIAGTNTGDGTIKDCAADVTVNGRDNVGGIAGKNDETVTGSTNTGSVTGRDLNTGGITGNNSGSITGSTNSGAVNGKDNVGGIAGSNGGNGKLKDNINSGNVTGNQGSTGAVIGINLNTNGSDITGNYYQKTDTVNTDLNGIGYISPDPAGITSGTTPVPEKLFEGSGTENDPYLISNKEELEKLRDKVNGGNTYKDKYFRVTENINLGGEGSPWTPIGTEEHPFEGTISGDGYGKTISGLYINDEAGDNQGLFGVNAGTIENLTVEGRVTGGDNVGGIAGTNTENGVIRDCTSNVTVAGENNVGGIAGKNDGSLKNDTNTGAVTGNNDVGGITGTNGENGTVQGCTNYGNVTGDSALGAIIGDNRNTDSDAVKDDYYQKTEEINKDLTGIGEGTGSGRDPEGITSGGTPVKPGQDQAAAKAFEDENIAAIERATPVGGTAWKQAVKDAKEAFDGLTDDQKGLVSENARKVLADAEAILAAVEKIEAIGTVTNTPESAKKIKDARDVYDKLTNEQKAKIPEGTKKVLTDAEAAYDALQKQGGSTEEQRRQIQTIANKLGVSAETAAKIQIIAEEMGIPAETLLLGDDMFAGQNSEGDLKGSTFSGLQAKASKVKANSAKLTWKKIKGADGYQIYGTPCGKGSKAKLIKTIKKNSTTTYTQKKLKKGKAYRYIVRAYKMVDGKYITIAASKCVHIFTNGGKYGNAKSVKVNKAKVSLKKGKKFTMKASEVKEKKPLRRHRKLSYESSNTKVATVTQKGVIKAIAKGTCTVYVYAQNGIAKQVKVTVK